MVSLKSKAKKAETINKVRAMSDEDKNRLRQSVKDAAAHLANVWNHLNTIEELLGIEITMSSLDDLVAGLSSDPLPEDISDSMADGQIAHIIEINT